MGSHPGKILGVSRNNLQSSLGRPLPSGYLALEAVDPIEMHPALMRIFATSEFRPRDDVEDDPSFKQIIPYITIRQPGFAGNIFAYRRRGDEARLAGLYSIGIGGHVEEFDLIPGGTAPAPGVAWPHRSAFVGGAMREVVEEVNVRGELDMPTFAGLINDDSTPVGSVHVGIHVSLSIDVDDVATRNLPDMAQSGWLHESLLIGMADRFESWSQILIGEVAASRRSSHE